MSHIKTLTLAAAATLSLGIGAAMANGESAGGADVNSRPAFPDRVMHRSIVTTYEWRTAPSYVYQTPSYTYHSWVPGYSVPLGED